MKLLLIDACGLDGSLALADTTLAKPVAAAVTLPGRTSSERLLPELRSMLASHAWLLSDLDAIGVVAGPGSFTGVRVGLAVAKGLCEAAALPLVVVSRLAVLAHQGATESGTENRTICAMLDAGRGEVFLGRFAPRETAPEVLLPIEAAIAAAQHSPLAVCEENLRRALVDLRPLFLPAFSAVDALPLIRSQIEAGMFSDVASSDANYLRRTDLETIARLAKTHD